MKKIILLLCVILLCNPVFSVDKKYANSGADVSQISLIRRYKDISRNLIIINKMKTQTRQLSEEEMEQILSNLEEEMDELMKEMEENAKLDEALDEMTKVLSGDMSPEDLEEMKKKHRAAEQRDIIKADMKYLKALFDKLSRDKEHAASSSGASSSPAQSFAVTSAEIPQAASSAPAAGAVTAAPSPEGQLIDVSV
jgi:hypothetical protein